ncbi:DUF378 domain-containing protein [Caedibacter taeniospiralis]|uniref:DUF378 domain-containing protein n=1 Tax=Caedibacter taeniospiralis TaxID=28907 RepID=UPI000C276115|nr:DUF378 domain-containing protein [Caedibacter taeniospiralis]
MRFLNTLALLLTIIGGFNWFISAVFNFNLITSVFSDSATWQKVTYVVIGLSSLYCLSLLKQIYTTK